MATLLARAILFVYGMDLALPALGLATPIQVFRGVFLSDLLVATYLALLTASGGIDSLFADARARRLGWMIVALGALGMISVGFNPNRALDIGQALHLVLFAGLFLLCVVWTRAHGRTFVLRWFLSGLVFGGVVNLYMTIFHPKALFKVIPVLYLQNGAGGSLALGVGLAAWLMLTRQDRRDAFIAVAAIGIGVVASALSWSKTAMSISAFGIVAWSALYVHGTRRRPLYAIAPMLAIVVVAMAAYSRFPSLPLLGKAVVEAVRIKFSGLSVKDKYSVGSRYTYFFGVAEIVSLHPLTGVSYGGFYDAMTRTSAYATGNAVDESPELGAQGSSNPHNTFLYYASANGIPGFVLAVGLFLLLFWYMWSVMEPYGLLGRILCGCLAMAFFIYANTLPTLYGTCVFHVPAGVVLARLALLHPVRRHVIRSVQSPEPGLA